MNFFDKDKFKAIFSVNKSKIEHDSAGYNNTSEEKFRNSPVSALKVAQTEQVPLINPNYNLDNLDTKGNNTSSDSNKESNNYSAQNHSSLQQESFTSLKPIDIENIVSNYQSLYKKDIIYLIYYGLNSSATIPILKERKDYLIKGLGLHIQKINNDSVDYFAKNVNFINDVILIKAPAKKIDFYNHIVKTSFINVIFTKLLQELTFEEKDKISLDEKHKNIAFQSHYNY